ncbi:MAG: sugar phosphate isomerase/epimerase [Planctomycetes bacterium]|nr:sugar phosphate isomerase/epimerase [Planctomycetota bacterium]
MKLSCLPVSMFSDFFTGELDIPKWGTLARNVGFDGFDISCMFVKYHTAVYLDELRKGITEAGIPLVMVTGYPDFTHPDPAQREREAAYLENDMALTAQLGGKYLRVLAGQNHPEINRAEGVRLAIAGLRQAAAAASRHGITLVYENHAKPGAWHYIDFSFPPELFLEILDGIRDTEVMVNFDTGNATAEYADPRQEVKLLEKIGDKLATVHVSDMKAPGVFQPVLVGSGVTPLGEIFACLKEKGFADWLCIEEVSGMGMEGVKKAHDNVRNAWEKA